MIQLALFGANGRMGKEIQELACQKTDTYRVAQLIGREFSPLDSAVDVVIDFSLAEAMPKFTEYLSQQKNTAVVSGTTGIDEKKVFKELAKTRPVLWSANMSLGINWMNLVLKHMMESLKSFDFQIEEIHHNRKKDAPSGTALLLQSTLEKSLQKKLPEPLSIRGGGVFGVHTVMAFSEQETLTLRHEALNRTVFAEGALVAAKWLKGKPPGLYSLMDVLGEL